jgi:hypothetical protein
MRTVIVPDTIAAMRLPCVRFTVRRLMVAVAVVAVAAGGLHLWELRVLYLRTALLHEVLSSLFQEGHACAGRDPGRSAHHQVLRIKYERAARRPWLPVEPDPPEPR